MTARDPEREVVGRLVDGEPIDWAEAASSDASILDALHTLDEVRNAYRRIGSANSPTTPVLFRCTRCRRSRKWVAEAALRFSAPGILVWKRWSR